jgi:hypothetical protein
MTHAELWSKFQDCGRRSLPAERLSELFDTLMTIAHAEDTRHLTRLLQP